MRRKGLPPVSLLVVIMVLVIVLALVLYIFSGSIMAFAGDINPITESEDLDYCDNVVSAYCEPLPEADWEDAYPECVEYADVISDGTTKCSEFTGVDDGSGEDGEDENGIEEETQEETQQESDEQIEEEVEQDIG